MQQLAFASAYLPFRLHHVFSSRHCVQRSRMSSTTHEERFDVLKPDGTHAGYSKARSAVHRDGDWHRSTHIWLVDTDGRILVQKRSELKDTFPGRWDVSAAGHISAGDKSMESAMRELEEELGIALKEGENLKLISSEKASATGSTERHGKFQDNEIQDIYVFIPERTIEIQSLKLQKEEVERVEYWNCTEYRQRLQQGDQQLVPRSPGYFLNVFPYLESLSTFRSHR